MTSVWVSTPLNTISAVTAIAIETRMNCLNRSRR